MNSKVFNKILCFSAISLALFSCGNNNENKGEDPVPSTERKYKTEKYKNTLKFHKQDGSE